MFLLAFVPVEPSVMGCSHHGCFHVKAHRDLPASTEDKSLPADAGDTGPTPGPGRFHVQGSNQAQAPQLLSLCFGIREPQLLQPLHLEPTLCSKKSHHKEKAVHHNEEQHPSPPLEKTHPRQQRPSTTINQ